MDGFAGVGDACCGDVSTNVLEVDTRATVTAPDVHLLVYVAVLWFCAAIGAVSPPCLILLAELTDRTAEELTTRTLDTPEPSLSRAFDLSN